MGAQEGEDRSPEPVGAEEIRAAARLIGLELTDDDIAAMADGVARNREQYAALRDRALDNAAPSALAFRPLIPGVAYREQRVAAWDGALPDAERPAELSDLAYADIPALASLVRSGRVSCVELARASLARLERLDPVLRHVVNLTPERALERARMLDREIEMGRWRGPLHGIPWGAKDLIAVRGYPTTWGTPPYRDQVLDHDATVVRALDDAGAVLVAKLSLGELAMGDRWFGGQTRNPWNPEQGSSGSSAGPAAAVASGCVPFAIGSETLGSIVSPSSVCGCSSVRPTYGRVSRYGAMTLAPSMDKLGPMCRTVLDAAIVLDAIAGPDGIDDTVADLPYHVPGPVEVAGMRIGYLERPFERRPEERSVLGELEALGAKVEPVDLPAFPAQEMGVILSAESAASFEELTRSRGVDRMVTREGWPTLFRTARLIPAVEYIHANRLRAELMRATDEVLSGVDAIVHPATTRYHLTLTNLTGHPCVAAPCGFDDDGTPRSIGFTGQLYGEAALLALAGAWQRSTGHHLPHPDL